MATQRTEAERLVRMRTDGRRILLVEDDELVRSLVESQLVALGYEVTSAEDAPTALAMLAAAHARGAPVELLMTDVMLPGDLDGFGLAREVRARWPELPILFASGNASNAAKARALGAPHLAKPYGLRELATTIEASITGAAAPKG